MQLQAGSFLKSTAAPDDTVFSRVSILITAYGPAVDGAVGYILDRPFGRSLRDLEEFRHARPFPLYTGGPVDQEHLYFVHRRPDLVEGGTPAGNGLYVGGNFSQAVAAINAQQLSPRDLKLFVGYCGWDAGELEAEIEEGSWTIVDGNADLVFA
ncbi:MAG: YqgE/AlgH family protein [Chitinophagaceae bacterium]|nr:MAG: YqgE/AlgH family protein [Chitinophagaceae bacterium]